MILGPQNGPRNHVKWGSIFGPLPKGGGSPKKYSKSKVFGSVFRYLKVADFYITILLYIRLLLDYYYIIIRLLLDYLQIIITLLLDCYQIIITLLLDYYQILIRLLLEYYQIMITFLLDYYQIIIKHIEIYINSVRVCGNFLHMLTRLS